MLWRHHTVNGLTKALLNHIPTVSSYLPIFTLCGAYHIELWAVASNRNVVLAFIGSTNPLGTARYYVCIKLLSGILCTVMSYVCILHPFLGTFCYK